MTNNKSKVLMVRVPTIIDSSASTAPICPPLGMAYLKRVISHYTDNIKVIDSVGNFPKTRSEYLGKHKLYLLGQNVDEIISTVPPDPEIIFISCMFSQDWLYAKEIIRRLREKCKGSVLIIGGEHVTSLPTFCLNDAPGLDMAVLGEGEAIVSEILKEYFLNSCKIPSEISGTYVRLPDGSIKENGRSLRIKKIDDIQWPDWDGFPLSNYFDGHHGFGVTLGSRSMPIMASRGCPYKCTFCSNPSMWTTKWKARSPQDVFKEMLFYKNKYKVDNFDFYDLTAIVKKDWIIKFCNILINNKLNITWQLPSGTRSEALDVEVAKLLYESGCRNLSYAPESGSTEVLKMIKKRINIDDMLQSMKASVSVGMNIKANIICGFPGENKRHLLDTLKFIIRVATVGCHDLSINQFSPYPGSELYEQLVRNNQITLDESYFRNLSLYSSMSNAVSYSNYLSNREILIFKFIGTILFYVISYCIRPWRVFTVALNVINKKETSRLEKSLISYLSRSFN